MNYERIVTIIQVWNNKVPPGSEVMVKNISTKKKKTKFFEWLREIYIASTSELNGVPIKGKF